MLTFWGIGRTKGKCVEPAEFKRWRKWMGLSQKEAAAALGLKRRVVQYYEKGERDGEPVAVPRSVRLACYALANGIWNYHGPSEEEAAIRQQERAEAKKKRKKARRKERLEATAEDSTGSESESASTPVSEPPIEQKAE